MVGVHRISGVPEPARTEQVTAYGTKPAKRSAARPDNLNISRGAQAALVAARLAEVAKALPDVTEERIVEAKEDLEQGLYRVQDVVRQVAARITPYVVV